ncbi:MAG: RTX toxin, partial [Pseudomonadota bacterium]
MAMAAVIGCAALATGTSFAQDDDWVSQGPAPNINGQTENVAPNNEVAGALEAIVTHPTDPDIIYVGGVNSGIWKTENASDPSPSWSNTTDGFDSLSIGSLDMDPTDNTNLTLVAGRGRFSSYLREGGSRSGLLRTTNGGQSWTVLDGGGTMQGRNVAAVAGRGSTIVAAINTADQFIFEQIGIFRSSDGGVTFDQISQTDGSSTGLPGGVTHDLGRDRSNPARLFTTVVFAGGAGGQNGIYRSTDTGATWSKVSGPNEDALITDDVSNIEFSVRDNLVYVGIVTGGRLLAVLRSANGGDSWENMGVPLTVEDGFDVGVNPGGQGSIHFSIQADPVDSNIVYVGGDRQPRFNEISQDPKSRVFPNAVGAFNFSGRLFRGQYAPEGGTSWTPLTHVGTASNSSPHADSREMAFDAAGNLLEVDDGGIYRRTEPRSQTGDWFSVNGNLAVTEMHGIAYDQLSNRVIGGTQDTGTPE